MQDPTSSATETTAHAVRGQGRLIGLGVAAIVLILLITAVALFFNLPDANAFNARVEALFIANADMTGNADIRMLEILARSGSAFSDTLASYRVGLFILLVFATALLIVAFVFLVVIVALNRRMLEVSRAGIQIDSLVVNRAEGVVYVNAMAFDLTDAAIETLAALCEAMLDVEIETFQIVGHTDATGAPSYNEQLSLLRAEEVKRHLVNDCGIGAERLQAVGVGEAFPANADDPNAELNRRVEFQALS